MRSLVVFLVFIGIVAAVLYYGFLAQPPPIDAHAQPTPVPRPPSSIAGMGEGATFLGSNRPIMHIDTPSGIVPQTTPPPKHH